MDTLETLSNKIWQGEASRVFLREWRSLAEKCVYEPGDLIVKQLHPAQYTYFLKEGEIEHSLRFDGSLGETSVGGVSLACFPLGWSGFSAPFRYATSARAKSGCTLYRWPIDALNQLFYAYPDMGTAFFHCLLETVLPLLDVARNKLKNGNGSTRLLLDNLADQVSPLPCESMSYEGRLELVSQALFMEVFPADYHDLLAEKATVEHFREGQQLYRQGTPSEKLMLLVSGAVAMSFEPKAGDREVLLRTYGTPGQVVATAAFSLSGQHEETATAATNVTVLAIDKAALIELGTTYPEFDLIFAKRLLWLLSARLRTLRIQMVAQQHDEEHVVIQNLLSLVSPQLEPSSKLYKLPHLLASRLTHAEARACLEDVKRHGSSLERTLAGVCLELLTELWRELAFYEGLQQVYSVVTQAGPFTPVEEVRRRCTQQFKQVFNTARFQIRGEENLPVQPGHIFILNHLISHPYHALANGFEFALDTHFVSAMILDQHYGDGGVRVVRRGRGEEHGHHSYYDRLGHIYVYTSESDQLLESEDEVELRREQFTNTAADYLSSGINLIVCPEGTSNWGRNSPSEFKKGLFHLAASLNIEPLIVPIAVAGFDKRLKNNAFTAVVHEPFYIKDKCEPHDKQSLERFLAEFRQTYRGYVVEAQALAEEIVR